MKLGTSLKRKAKNSAKQTLYMAMWGQEVPKGKKKVNGRKSK